MAQTENFCLKCGTACVWCNGWRCRCWLTPAQVFISNQDIRKQQKIDSTKPLHKLYIEAKEKNSAHMTVEEKQKDYIRWIKQMNAW
jgi:protein subunit release factor B